MNITRCPHCSGEFHLSEIKVFRRGCDFYCDERVKQRRGSGKGLHPSIWQSLGPPPDRRKADRRKADSAHSHMRASDYRTGGGPYRHRRSTDFK